MSFIGLTQPLVWSHRKILLYIFCELTENTGDVKRYGVIGPMESAEGNAVERAWPTLKFQQNKS